MLGHCLPITCYWLQRTALLQLSRKQSRQWFLTACSGYSITQGNNWHPARHHVLQYWICCGPYYRNQCTFTADPHVHAISRSYLVCKMCCKFPCVQNGNCGDLEQLTSWTLAIQVVNSSRALQLSRSVLGNCFIRVPFQPHFMVRIILHYHWPNYIDQMNNNEI